jgi:dTDP-4-dehydrorhamnose reductase
VRVLLTGARGMLGTDLSALIRERHELHPIDIEEVDITDGPATMALIEKIRPDAIIHTAAYTDVDGCESHVDQAFQVNGEGTRHVAEGAHRSGASMLYVSTDYVFDGKSASPYRVEDEPRPMSVYGKSKLRGEVYTRELAAQHYIVRTGWLYGEHGANFVEKVIGLARDRPRLEIVDDQVGSPTYSKDLAPALLRLVESGRFGTYHVTNDGSCSWFEFARHILDLAGIEDIEVVPTTSERLARPAPRPPYSVLDNSAWREVFGSGLRHWREAIEEYVRHRPR